jgi:hypothetical protein
LSSDVALFFVVVPVGKWETYSLYTFPQAVSPFFGLQVGPFKEVFAARLPFAL